MLYIHFHNVLRQHYFCISTLQFKALNWGNRCSARLTSARNNFDINPWTSAPNLNFGTEVHWNVNFGIMQKDYVCRSKWLVPKFLCRSSPVPKFGYPFPTGLPDGEIMFENPIRTLWTGRYPRIHHMKTCRDRSRRSLVGMRYRSR